MITFIVALIVLVIIAGFFTIIIVDNLKKEKILIANGFNDKEVLKQHGPQGAKKRKALRITGSVVSYIVLVALLGLLAFSAYSGATYGKRSPLGAPQLVAIASGSMSKINSSNPFSDDISSLTDGRRSFQFDAQSLLVIQPVPEQETDLRVFDVVAYLHPTLKVVVIHRIIEIQSDTVTGQIGYMLQGDANPVHDIKPIVYENIVGVYKGQHVSHIGAFVLFMQAPIGIIAAVTCVYLVVIIDIMRTKENKYELERYKVIETIQN